MVLPKTSVVILTRNAGPGFLDLLDRLVAQQTNFRFEIVVVDSGSTDGTVELAESYGATVHRTSVAEFNHGATRNLGVSRSRGEYVALLVQDALPLDEQWLQAMVENFEREPLVAGVYSRQMPRPENSPLARVLVESWPTASPERREQFADSPELYRKMLPEERRTLAAFDNVSSCLRRSVWEDIPFDHTRFGEDLRWGKRITEAGYKIVYEPRSTVLHAHERGTVYDLRRYYVDARLLLELFGIASTPNSLSLLLNVLRSSVYLYRRLRQDRETMASAPRVALLAARHAFFGQVGAYLGSKERRLAWAGPRLSAMLERVLSGGV